MKCPACANDLTELAVGRLKVDACQNGCGGIWFDGFELQRVDQEDEAEGEVLLHIRVNPAVRVDFTLKRNCPRCDGVKLKRHFFSAKRHVEIDQCPGCGGYWLDHGELAKIRAEKSHADRIEKARASADAVSAHTIRHIYRLRTENRP